MSIRKAVIASAAAITAALASSQALAGPISLASFQRETGIKVDESKIQQAWNALETMGTTKFLGGMLGNLKLDESSLIAGALSIGASEFDTLLNGGGINTASSGAVQSLLSNMNSAAGLDLSYITGSFSNGGGQATTASLMSGSGASFSGACDTSVASALAENGKAHVDKIVTAAMSGEFGFSKVKDLQSSNGSGSGFGALGCLDKLFQNSGSDIMFKPPSLGTLTTQIQNWVCGQASSVQEQVAGAFGAGEIFQTGAMGGFFPSKTFGEANDGNPNTRPGLGQEPALTFGAQFAAFQDETQDQIAKAADIQRLFK